MLEILPEVTLALPIRYKNKERGLASSLQYVKKLLTAQGQKKKKCFSSALSQPTLPNISGITASQWGQSLHWDDMLTTSELLSDTENPFLCEETHARIWS